ncbi:MAG TPA: hypothetical protein VLX11_08330, partial [Candidatus Acidoferrales bacterium]|nr:hypothetical protein [Candidatus Acidoferrales bacterium]
PENPLYSISLGVASLQVGSVGVPTALSPVSAGHFKFHPITFIVGSGLKVLPFAANHPQGYGERQTKALS